MITGKQASGKSTIAKWLYFFLSVPDGLDRFVTRVQGQTLGGSAGQDGINSRFKLFLKSEVEGIFGISNSVIGQESEIKMEYTDKVYLRIAYKKSLIISYSNELRDFVTKITNTDWSTGNKLYNTSSKKVIGEFFRIDYSPVYIPAGRSIMTVVGSQFELFYSTLDDRNKGLIDLCTRNYCETVMRIKPLFVRGYQSLAGRKLKADIEEKALSFMHGVIQGEYYYSNGGEYLQLDNGENVNLNMASSGQQEALWIYNILMYYASSKQKKFYIIEEPESNLFPASQQIISRFLGVISNLDNPMLINTHSPYVLGELNNMLYAGEISGRTKKKQTYDVIPKECQLRFDMMQGLFVENGEVSDCMDYDIKQIDNMRLDLVSGDINEEYEKLMNIERREK